MFCRKCGKRIDRPDGGPVLIGVQIIFEGFSDSSVGYYRNQLGKYADEQGQCHIEVCYECFIDAFTGGK